MTRHDRLDALRGLAIVWMAAYHFGFDLNHFGLLQPPQRPHSDPLWMAHRTGILSLFLFCAGVSVAVALHQGQSWARFGRRWLQVATCAVMVSVATLVVFPRSWIFFGVLHGMAVMLVLARLAAPLGAWLWPLGALALALPRVLQLPELSAPGWSWIGLVTHKPLTEDYVPVLPWLGVMLWGVAAGQWVLRRRTAWLQGAVPRGVEPLAWLGRWSLSFYMVHQPVFFGLLMAWLAVRPRS